MAKGSRDVTVGLFVLIFGAAFIWGILWISAGGPPQANDHYITYLTESVSGLYVDAPVNYQGVDVGKVESIRIAPNNPRQVELVLQIRAGTPVTESTVAVLEFQGLTGIANVNLIPGLPDAAPIAASGAADYPVIPSQPSLYSRLESSAAELFDGLSGTAEQINGLLGSVDGEELGNAFRNLSLIAERVAEQSKRLDQLVTRLDGTLINLEAASGGLPELLDSFVTSAQAVTQAAQSINQLSNDFGAASGDFAGAMARGGSDVAQFTGSALPELNAMLVELRVASANLRQASEALAADPSILLFGAQPPELGPGER